MLEIWAHKSLMKYNKVMCKVLHFERGNPRYKYRLNSIQTEELIESRPVEKVLGVLNYKKLDMSQQSSWSQKGQ